MSAETIPQPGKGVTEAAQNSDPHTLWSGEGMPAALLLDASAHDGLPARLERSGLPHTCLFSGPDAETLAEEAPYLATLDPQNATASRSLLNFVIGSGAGAILMHAPVELDRQRTHLRKWLSVHLPKGHSREDKPVLFRFYDPAILAAFLGTLTPADAAAFFGPIERIVTVETRAAKAFSLTDIARATPRSTFPPDGLYRISETQYAILAKLTGDTFRTDLARYLRSEFSPETRDMSDEEMHALIDAAIADADRIGDKRQGSVLSLVVIRLLRPDLLEDAYVMKQVMVDHPLAAHPNQRVGLLLGILTSDFQTLDERSAFFARLNRFWTEEF
ncbi:MAG: DUF4123 domain-containing protein [Roseovarius sp.]|uniref:DUF4123 domain-containing protein n=1 Tax=Roseovarius sp. TaxID=1486281 RepID=UPI0032ED887C